VQAFETEAFDYVLKPIDDVRFVRTLERIEARVSERDATAPTRLMVRDRGKIVALEPATIDWVQSDGDYVRIHAGVASYLHHTTLTSLAADLPADKFLRVHRSAIVNVDRIHALEPLANGDASIRLTTGARVRLSRTYRDALSRKLRAKL
jgi:two-component system, LytTR family, response regulator